MDIFQQNICIFFVFKNISNNEAAKYLKKRFKNGYDSITARSTIEYVSKKKRSINE